MTYEANTDVPSQQTGTFLILSPKRFVTGWTLFQLDGWMADFDHGYVSRVYVDGQQFTRQATKELASVSPGGFFYDEEDAKLYIYSTVDPDTDPKYVVVHYEIYLSDQDRVWYRDPKDSSSGEVFWHGAIIESPRWLQQNADLLFGFFPLDASNLNVINAAHLFDRHLYDSSWNFAGARVYHLLGDAAIANIRQVFVGFTRDVELSDSGVSIELETLFRVLDNQYHTGEQRFFASADFPNIEPSAVNPGSEWAIRRVFGMVDGLVPVNIDYNETKATNVNRDYVVSTGGAFPGTAAQLNLVIDHTGTNTATQTTLMSADGLNLGDWVYLQHASATDHAVKVVTVNYATKVITHVSIGARTITAGDLCIREFVGSVTVRVNGETDIELHPVRDFTIASFANNTRGIVLVDNFEANFPLTLLDGSSWTILDPFRDTVYVRAYGEKDIDDYQSTVLPVTTVNQRGGNLNNIAAIAYQFLRDIETIEPLLFDDDSVAAAVAARTDLIGFTVPLTRNESEYPTYKDLLTPLLKTGLMRIQMNDVDGECALGLSLIGPTAVSADKSVDSSQFAKPIFRLSHKDIASEVKVKFYQSDFRPAFPFGLGDNTTEPFFISSSGESPTARFLHGVRRSIEVTTFHVWPPEALDFAARVLSIMAERKGTVTLRGKNDFIRAELGETYQVDRESLPGYSHEEGTTRSRKFAVSESDKSPSGVTIVLDDQKGIEDNLGSW